MAHYISCWYCLAPWEAIVRNDNSYHYDSCKYYQGTPGGNPAPPTPPSPTRSFNELPSIKHSVRKLTKRSLVTQNLQEGPGEHSRSRLMKAPPITAVVDRRRLSSHSRATSSGSTSTFFSSGISPTSDARSSRKLTKRAT